MSRPRDTAGEVPLGDARPLQQLREIDPSGVFLRRWIEQFLNDAPVKVAEMEGAMKAGITPPVIRGAHSLKTYAGWLGSQPLWQLCHRMEQEARAGAVPECQRLLPDLKQELSLFEEWLTTYLGTQA